MPSAIEFFTCRCCRLEVFPEGTQRRFAWLLAAIRGEASDVSTSRRLLRSSKIPKSKFTTLPNALNFLRNISRESLADRTFRLRSSIFKELSKYFDTATI